MEIKYDSANNSAAFHQTNLRIIDPVLSASFLIKTRCEHTDDNDDNKKKQPRNKNIKINPAQ